MQVIRGFSTNVSRSSWLHWLNSVGNVELRGEVSLRGRGRGQATCTSGEPALQGPSARAAVGLTRCCLP